MKLLTSRRTIIGVTIAVVLIGILLAFLLYPKTGWKETRDGRYYLVDSQPILGWQQIDGRTHYFDPESGLLHTGWLTLSDCKYFLDENGCPTVGLLSRPEGVYFFNEDGKMATGLQQTPEGLLFLNEDGQMLTGWQETPSGHLHFGEDGYMTTGWLDEESGTIYLDSQGKPVTGWLKLDTGTWYLKEDGHPYTGWMQTEEARYYFLEDGTMAVGAFKIDGAFRYFSSDGNYVPLVNPWNVMPDDYTPDLVSIEGHKVDFTCVNALNDLLSAARAAGLTCILNSTYRNISTQTSLWNNRYNDYLSKGYSEDEAYQLSARRVAYPGTSEHHTGLAIDIIEIVKDGTLYQWFREHAWEYGFTVRYREDKEKLTGVMDEPWHLRYVGKEVAQVLQERDLCLEEFFNELS